MTWRHPLSACTAALATVLLSSVCGHAAFDYPVFTNDTAANTLSFNDTFGHTVIIGSYSPSTGTWTALGVAGGFTNITVSGNATVAGTTGLTGQTTVVNLAATGLVNGSGFTALFASPPPIGSTAPNTGAFTTLSASSTLSGAGFNSLISAPPVGVGSVTPNGGAFTTLSASMTVSGAGFANYLLSPPAIGNIAPNTGAFTTLTASSTFSATGTSTQAAINSSGNHQITGGSLVPIDLQTTPPTNGSFLSNAGASFQNLPLIGGLAGAHQFSAAYFKNTAQFDATKAEYMVTIDSSLNSGKSPQWVTGTTYGAGAFVVNAGKVYSTVAGGVAGASAPTCGSGSCSDGTVTWVWQTSSFAAAKVGLFNSTITGANSAYSSWGMSNDFVIGAGDTGAFKIGAEFDLTNNAVNTANIGYNAINLFLSGNIGTFPVTAEIEVNHPANGTNYAARYGLLFTGGYEASQATIADQTTNAVIGIDLSTAVYSTGLGIKLPNADNIAWLNATPNYTAGVHGSLFGMASDNNFYFDSYDTGTFVFRGSGYTVVAKIGATPGASTKTICSDASNNWFAKVGAC